MVTIQSQVPVGPPELPRTFATCVSPQITTGPPTKQRKRTISRESTSVSLILKDTLTVLASTASRDVATAPNATTNTSVEPVVPPNTAPRSIRANEVPFSTRLIPDEWERLLAESGAPQKYTGIPKGLREGFYIGLEKFTLSSTYIPPNHFRTEQHAQIIREKFTSEIALGRISQGFTPEELQLQIGNFTTAPMAVVEQCPGKFRIVIDHSFPKCPLPPSLSHETHSLPEGDTPLIPFDASETSINSLIVSDDFPCEWGTFADCFLMVAEAPEGSFFVVETRFQTSPHTLHLLGTQAAVFDVDAAFRNIPIHKSVRHFVALMLDDLIFMDLMLNFGKRPAPGIWGHVADTMAWILKYKGVDALLK